MGYQKPFRSWGRSLLANKADETPRAFVTNTQFYQLIQGNFIYVLDLQGEVVGVYAKDDLNLTHNLKDQIAHNEEMKKGIADMRAFMQDFMNRIINDKLQWLPNFHYLSLLLPEQAYPPHRLASSYTHQALAIS